MSKTATPEELQKLSKDELFTKAADMGIKLPKKSNKTQLIEAITTKTAASKASTKKREFAGEY